MKALLCSLLLTGCAPVIAESLYLGAWSSHFNKGDYNEQHNLVAYEHKDWTIGYFKNSYNRDTVFIAHDFKYKFRNIEVGAMAGVMRGYRVCYGDDESNADVCPMVAPYLEITDAPVRPRFLLFGLDAAAVAVRIEW